MYAYSYWQIQEVATDACVYLPAAARGSREQRGRCGERGWLTGISPCLSVSVFQGSAALTARRSAGASWRKPCGGRSPAPTPPTNGFAASVCCDCGNSTSSCGMWLGAGSRLWNTIPYSGGWGQCPWRFLRPETVTESFPRVNSHSRGGRAAVVVWGHAAAG